MYASTKGPGFQLTLYKQTQIEYNNKMEIETQIEYFIYSHIRGSCPHRVTFHRACVQIYVVVCGPLCMFLYMYVCNVCICYIRDISYTQEKKLN